MMVFYYSLDSMLGLLEAYFAFKLLRERYRDIKPVVSVYKVQKVRQDMDKTWTRQGQDMDKTGTRQGQDRDKTGTREVGGRGGGMARDR